MIPDGGTHKWLWKVIELDKYFFSPYMLKFQHTPVWILSKNIPDKNYSRFTYAVQHCRMPHSNKGKQSDGNEIILPKVKI